MAVRQDVALRIGLGTGYTIASKTLGQARVEPVQGKSLDRGVVSPVHDLSDLFNSFRSHLDNCRIGKTGNFGCVSVFFGLRLNASNRQNKIAPMLY